MSIVCMMRGMLVKVIIQHQREKAFHQNPHPDYSSQYIVHQVAIFALARMNHFAVQLQLPLYVRAVYTQSFVCTCRFFMSLHSRFRTHMQVVGLTQSAYPAGKRSTTTQGMDSFTHQKFSFTQWAFVFAHKCFCLREENLFHLRPLSAIPQATFQITRRTPCILARGGQGYEILH